MHRVLKYANIENKLPDLGGVLRDSLQNDVLQIRLLDKESDKFIQECDRVCSLKEAVYVVYSPHIKKENHEHELFLFLDDTGNIVCHVGGTELELYGLLKPIKDLEISEAYKYTLKPHS